MIELTKKENILYNKSDLKNARVARLRQDFGG